VQQFPIVTGLPALTFFGLADGGFLGGLLVFVSIILMVEVQFSIEEKSQERSKK
jgi:hypothetical protein